MYKKFCPNCGEENERNLRYCTNCGNDLIEDKTDVVNSNDTNNRKNYNWLKWPIGIGILLFVIHVLFGGRNYNTHYGSNYVNFDKLSEKNLAGHSLKLELDKTHGYKHKIMYFNFYKNGYFTITSKAPTKKLDDIDFQTAYDKTNNALLRNIDVSQSDDDDDYDIGESLKSHGLSDDPDQTTANMDEVACNWAFTNNNLVMKFGYRGGGYDFIDVMKFRHLSKVDNNQWKCKFYVPDWVDQYDHFEYNATLTYY